MVRIRLRRTHVYAGALRGGIIREIATGRSFSILLLLHKEIQHWLKDRDFSIEMDIMQAKIGDPYEDRKQIRRVGITLEFTNPNDALMFKLTF